MSTFGITAHLTFLYPFYSGPLNAVPAALRSFQSSPFCHQEYTDKPRARLTPSSQNNGETTSQHLELHILCSYVPAFDLSPLLIYRACMESRTHRAACRRFAGMAKFGCSMAGRRPSPRFQQAQRQQRSYNLQTWTDARCHINTLPSRRGLPSFIAPRLMAGPHLPAQICTVNVLHDHLRGLLACL